MKVFVVQNGWYDDGTVDSVWFDKGAADARAAQLRAQEPYQTPDQPGWEVVAFRANEPAAEILEETTGNGDLDA